MGERVECTCMEVPGVLASFDKVLTFEVTVWLRPTHTAALRVTASLPTYTVPLHCNTRSSLQKGTRRTSDVFNWQTNTT